MKYIKEYNAGWLSDITIPGGANQHPEVGDYIVCKGISYDMNNDSTLKNFIDTHIGQIIGIHINTDPAGYDYHSIEVEYDKNEISKRLKNFFRFNTLDFTRKDVLFWSKSKEELELKMSTNKYNL